MVDFAYIHDGYTKDGYIRAVPGLYPAVVFKFRPATAAQAEIIMGRTRRESNDDIATTFMANVIARHVIEWDVKNHKGDTIAIASDEVKKLAHGVFQRLFSMIVGVSPSEAPVENNGEHSKADGDTDYDSVMKGVHKETLEIKN